ncbi:MAG: hypothetical protein CML66_04140 [Rhodobacteraceae bacterium]|nr:hypothetical protein [Paracoccaceae bacterium]|tara:strand:+ start:506 stop:727 length:222 start_codon:yes stop_codon:yes gene_type:complete
MCNRHSPKLEEENEQIADLLVGPTIAKKTWGAIGASGPCATSKAMAGATDTKKAPDWALWMNEIGTFWRVSVR